VPDAPILADVLRRPTDLRLLVLCGLVGIPVSVIAFGSIIILAAVTAFTELIDPPQRRERAHGTA
jgi:hypothetical protein